MNWGPETEEEFWLYALVVLCAVICWWSLVVAFNLKVAQ